MSTVYFPVVRSILLWCSSMFVQSIFFYFIWCLLCEMNVLNSKVLFTFTSSCLSYVFKALLYWNPFVTFTHIGQSQPSFQIGSNFEYANEFDFSLHVSFGCTMYIHQSRLPLTISSLLYLRRIHMKSWNIKQSPTSTM